MSAAAAKTKLAGRGFENLARKSLADPPSERAHFLRNLCPDAQTLRTIFRGSFCLRMFRYRNAPAAS